MFIGMLDAKGRSYPPDVVTRMPSERIRWSVEYHGEGQVLVTNLNPFSLQIKKNIEHPRYITLFAEIDSKYPFTKAAPVDIGFRTAAGDTIDLAPRAFSFMQNLFSNEGPSAGDHLSEARDEAQNHLNFIHRLAYSATGDLRQLARDYLKKVLT